MPSTTAIHFSLPRLSVHRACVGSSSFGPSYAQSVYSGDRRPCSSSALSPSISRRRSNLNMSVHQSIDSSRGNNYLGVRINSRLTTSSFLSMSLYDFVRIINLPFRSFVSFTATILSRSLLVVVLLPDMNILLPTFATLAQRLMFPLMHLVTQTSCIFWPVPLEDRFNELTRNMDKIYHVVDSDSFKSKRIVIGLPPSAITFRAEVVMLCQLADHFHVKLARALC